MAFCHLLQIALPYVLFVSLLVGGGWGGGEGVQASFYTTVPVHCKSKCHHCAKISVKKGPVQQIIKFGHRKNAVIIPKFQQCGFTRVMLPNDADRLKISVDPDQTAPTVFAQTCLFKSLGPFWYYYLF